MGKGVWSQRAILASGLLIICEFLDNVPPNTSVIINCERI